MGDTFVGIIGNFNGFALENSDFNPQSDDSNIKFFFDEETQTRPIRKFKKRRRRSRARSIDSSAGFGNGGMSGGF